MEQRELESALGFRKLVTGLSAQTRNSQSPEAWPCPNACPSPLLSQTQDSPGPSMGLTHSLSFAIASTDFIRAD